MRAVEHVHLETGESEVTVGSGAPTSRRIGTSACHGVAVRWVRSVPTTPPGVPMERPWSCLLLPPVRNEQWVAALFGYR